MVSAFDAETVSNWVGPSAGRSRLHDREGDSLRTTPTRASAGVHYSPVEALCVPARVSPSCLERAVEASGPLKALALIIENPDPVLPLSLHRLILHTIFGRGLLRLRACAVALVWSFVAGEEFRWC